MTQYRLFPFFLILYEFSTYLSNDMYLPAFPILGSDFSVHDDRVQLTMTAWLFGNALLQLLIGPLSDRWGRRPVLFFGGVMFVVASLLCRYVISFELFLLLRFIQGVGVSTMMIPGYATIHELYDDRAAIRLIALMGSFAVLAPMIAPFGGSLILEFYSWRLIFDVVGVLALLSLSGLFFVMPESLVSRSTTLGLKSLVALYGRIIRTPRFMGASLSIGLVFGAVIVWIAEGPFLLMRHYHLSPMVYSLSQIPIFSAYIIGAQFVRFFGERIETQKWIKVALIFGIMSLLGVLILALMRCSNLFLLLGVMSCFMLSFGMLYAPLSRMAMTALDVPKGAISSGFYFLTTCCGVLGTFILAYLPGEGLLTFAILMMSMVILARVAFSWTHRL